MHNILMTMYMMRHQQPLIQKALARLELVQKCNLLTDLLFRCGLMQWLTLEVQVVSMCILKDMVTTSSMCTERCYQVCGLLTLENVVHQPIIIYAGCIWIKSDNVWVFKAEGDSGIVVPSNKANFL